MGLWLLGLTIFLADPWTGSLGAENAGISRLGSVSFTLQKWRTETNLELQVCIFLINHKKYKIASVLFNRLLETGWQKLW